MQPAKSTVKLQTPALLKQAEDIASYLKKQSIDGIAKAMKITPALATKTAATIADWSADASKQSLALDAFKGDIYSGLQAHELTPAQRDYANKHLVILSGLYGIIRPYDGIMPYRLEMMYKFPDTPYDNLYTFWGQQIADQLPKSGKIINTSSVEYSKTILPFVDAERVKTPQFFTVSPKTNEPTFVTVHSKIARGAFARWLIINNANDDTDVTGFDLLGYKYDAALSQPGAPAYVTKDFGGIGLSIRLLNKN